RAMLAIKNAWSSHRYIILVAAIMAVSGVCLLALSGGVGTPAAAQPSGVAGTMGIVTLTPCAPSAFNQVPSPNATDGFNYLYNVGVVSSTDAWAVGFSRPEGSSSEATLIEHWNGSSWTIVPSPNPGILYNRLRDITV